MSSGSSCLVTDCLADCQRDVRIHKHLFEGLATKLSAVATHDPKEAAGGIVGFEDYFIVPLFSAQLFHFTNHSIKSDFTPNCVTLISSGFSTLKCMKQSI